MTTSELLAKADAAIAKADQAITLSKTGRTIASLERTIMNMKRVMRDNDICCVDCNGTLTDDELETGMCTDCARLLS